MRLYRELILWLSECVTALGVSIIIVTAMCWLNTAKADDDSEAAEYAVYACVQMINETGQAVSDMAQYGAPLEDVIELLQPAPGYSAEDAEAFIRAIYAGDFKGPAMLRAATAILRSCVADMLATE